MPNSPAKDIAQILDDLSDLSGNPDIGTQGTEIFVSEQPNLETLTISIYDTGGPEPNPKFLRDFPSVQIVVRGTVRGYQVAYAKAQNIKDLLLGKDPTLVDDSNYVSFRMLGDIISLGKVDDRPLLALNFLLVIDQAVVGNSNRLVIT